MATTTHDLIILDKENPECCMIDTDELIRQALTDPIPVPSWLSELEFEQGETGVAFVTALAEFCDALVSFAYGRHRAGDHVICSHCGALESDLNKDLSFLHITPDESSDRFWDGSTFVWCRGRLYSLQGNTLAECGLLEDRLGWYVAPIGGYEPDEHVDDANNRCSAGYSHNPYDTLLEMGAGKHEPIWSEERGGFLFRLEGCPYPCLVTPDLTIG